MSRSIRRKPHLQSVSADLARRFPDTNKSDRAVIAPLATDIVRNVERSLVVMWCAVGLVLLIASVNLANLLFVRAVGQRHELAIRRALGASRSQIAVDMLGRGLTLAILGGTAGCLLGIRTRDALVAIAPPSIPRLGEVALNTRVLAMTATLSLISGVLLCWFAAGAPTMATGCGRAESVRSRRLSQQPDGAPMAWAAGLGGSRRGAFAGGCSRPAHSKSHAAESGRPGLRDGACVDLERQTARELSTRVRRRDMRSSTQLTSRIALVPGVAKVAFANRFPMRGGWGGGLILSGFAGPEQVEADFQVVSRISTLEILTFEAGRRRRRSQGHDGRRGGQSDVGSPVFRRSRSIGQRLDTMSKRRE